MKGGATTEDTAQAGLSASEHSSRDLWTWGRSNAEREGWLAAWHTVTRSKAGPHGYAEQTESQRDSSEADQSQGL